VTEATEKLRIDTLECAQSLLDGDWSAAARSARRANWRWQRLPDDEANSYVKADEPLDGAYPVRGLDEESELAFVAWLVWRCNRLSDAVRREYSHANATYDAQQAADRLRAERLAADAQRVQGGLFDVTEVRTHEPRRRLKD
jgi:hypothetical protein